LKIIFSEKINSKAKLKVFNKIPNIFDSPWGVIGQGVPESGELDEGGGHEGHPNVICSLTELFNRERAVKVWAVGRAGACPFGPSSLCPNSTRRNMVSFQGITTFLAKKTCSETGVTRRHVVFLEQSSYRAA
jgi:hypothetical protein